jgi:hypothetical protein
MMAKLEAGHAADAVRLWLDAQHSAEPAAEAEAEAEEPPLTPEIAEGDDEAWSAEAERRRRRGQRQ